MFSKQTAAGALRQDRVCIIDIRLYIYFINNPIPQRNHPDLPPVAGAGHLEQQQKWSADRSVTHREILTWLLLGLTEPTAAQSQQRHGRPACQVHGSAAGVRFCFDSPQLVFP